MLKKIMQAIKNMAGAPVHFDPVQFNDPVALRTEWTPLKAGGANFRTHKLVASGPDRMEFKATAGAKLFLGLFLFIGLAVIIGFSFERISSGKFSFSMDTIMPYVFGIIFATVGGTLLYYATNPVVFDKRKKLFWKGRKVPDEVFDRRNLKEFVGLDRIHALQIISEHCQSNKSSYTSYELNVVLQDGMRINVVDHGNKEKLRDDAKTLAGFLEKPIWDIA